MRLPIRQQTPIGSTAWAAFDYHPAEGATGRPTWAWVAGHMGGTRLALDRYRRAVWTTGPGQWAIWAWSTQTFTLSNVFGATFRMMPYRVPQSVPMRKTCLVRELECYLTAWPSLYTVWTLAANFAPVTTEPLTNPDWFAAEGTYNTDQRTRLVVSATATVRLVFAAMHNRNPDLRSLPRGILPSNFVSF